MSDENLTVTSDGLARSHIERALTRLELLARYDELKMLFELIERYRADLSIRILIPHLAERKVALASEIAATQNWSAREPRT